MSGALLAPGFSFVRRRRTDLDLPADVELGPRVERAAGARADGADAGAGGADLDARAGGIVDHQLDPQRAVVAEPRGLAGLAQRGEAGRLRAADGRAETG